MRFQILAVFTFLLLVSPSTALSQTGVINQNAAVLRNVILRQGPSTESPELETLVPGDDVTVFDGPRLGYYHVKTAHKRIGWVWMKNIKLAPSVVPMNLPLS